MTVSRYCSRSLGCSYPRVRISICTNHDLRGTDSFFSAAKHDLEIFLDYGCHIKCRHVEGKSMYPESTLA